MDVYDVQRLLHDPEQQAQLQDPDLSDLTLRAIANYGVTNDRELIRPLIGLYRLASGRLTEQTRRQIYVPIREGVEAGQLSVNALLPFLLEDPARSVASTAALDYAVMRPLNDGEPLSGPKEVLGMALGVPTANAGALLGGLLLLGDRRVMKLLAHRRDQIGRTELKTMTQCQSGFLFSAVVEFYLDWLEGLTGDRDDNRFGLVASGLYNIRQGLLRPIVTDLERVFPAPLRGKAIRVRRTWSLDEYTKLIAPRLLDLERQEPEPKVMPVVLAAWGCETATLLRFRA